MLEKLNPYRELLAFIVLGSAVVTILASFINALVFSRAGLNLLSFMSNALPIWWYPLLVAAVVLVRLKPATAHSDLISLLALIIGAVEIVIMTISSLLMLATSAGPVGPNPNSGGLAKFGIFLSFVAPLAVKGAMVFVIHVLRSSGQKLTPIAAATGSRPYGQPSQQEIAPSSQSQRPVWQADQASGGAWTRAGDAASGASASHWGVPGSGNSGWQPNQQQGNQQQGGYGQGFQQSASSYPSASQPGGFPGQGTQGRDQLPWNGDQNPDEGTVLRPRPDGS